MNFVTTILSSIVLFTSSQFQFSIDNASSLYFNSERIHFSITQKALKEAYFIITLEDSIGTIVGKEIISAKNESNGSSILLEDYLPSGTYLLRCRETMSDEYLSEVPITVVNTKTFSLNQSIASGTSHPISTRSHHSKFNPLKIKGRVLSEGKKPMQGVIVLMQTRGATPTFNYTKTDVNGVFDFNTELYGDNELLLSTPNALEKSVVEVQDFHLLKEEKASSITPFKIDRSKLDDEELKKLVIRQDRQSTIAVSEEKKLELLNYDLSHSVADYFSFETTYDFIKSAVKNKKIRTEKVGKAKGTSAMDADNPKQRIIRLMNHSNGRFFKYEPTYMIDDFIVPSFEHILALNIKDVEQVKLIHAVAQNSRILGRFGYNGVLSVYTKNGDYQPKTGLLLAIDGINRSTD